MNLYDTAICFRKEISERKANGYGNWSWEHLVPGPLEDKEWRFISEVAGCWCYSNSTDPVRFYTNHNHPMWR